MYEIYTDGSCHTNDNKHPSAHAIAVYLRGQRKGTKTGFFEIGSNNKSELEAVLMALRWIKKAKVNATIHSDSSYVLQGITSWMYSWQKKGWKKSDNKPIQNLEQWKEAFALAQELKENIRFNKVKAHSGIEGNELADRLANITLTEVEVNGL